MWRSLRIFRNKYFYVTEKMQVFRGFESETSSDATAIVST